MFRRLILCNPVNPPTAPVVTMVVLSVMVYETCSRLEANAKKLGTEQGQLRQKNSLRQKYDSNTANLWGCGEQCKLNHQQMDHEICELHSELTSMEEAKHNAENRNFEQEVGIFVMERNWTES